MKTIADGRVRRRTRSYTNISELRLLGTNNSSIPSEYNIIISNNNIYWRKTEEW